MVNKYAISPTETKLMNTADLRENFLLQNLAKADECTLIYTHYDRMIVGGIMPVSKETGNCIDFIHGVVSIIDNSRTQEQAKDLFSSHIFHEHACDLFGLKRAASHIRSRTQRAVLAVVCTSIREESF